MEILLIVGSALMLGLIAGGINSPVLAAFTIAMLLIDIIAIVALYRSENK